MKIGYLFIYYYISAEHAADQRLAALNVGEMTGMIEKLHPLIEFLLVVDLLISFIKYSHSHSLHQNNPHNLHILC